MIKTKIQTMQGHQINLHLLKGVFIRQLNDKMIKNDKNDMCGNHMIAASAWIGWPIDIRWSLIEG